MTKLPARPAAALLGRAASEAAGLGRLLGKRPSLLTITAGVAAVAAVANTVAAVAAPEAPAPAPTRLGVSIQQSVQDKDQAMARQRRALELREQAALAAEQRLKAGLASRQDPAAAPGVMPAGGSRGGGEGGDQANQPYDDLARIYQTMKPARAAPVFEQLDLDVQTEVARRMRERATALIMSSMSPSAAVKLSMALAGRTPIAPVVAPPPAPVPAPVPVAVPAKAVEKPRAVRTRASAARRAKAVRAADATAPADGEAATPAAPKA